MEAPNFPFSPQTIGMNGCPFWLVIAVSSSPFNFVNAQLLRADFWCKECALIKLIGLLLTTDDKPTWRSFSPR